VTGLTFSVWFCHHHQAYFSTKSVYTQRTDDMPETAEYVHKEWGPFDTWEDVTDWLTDALPIDGLAPL
jgi:hypothetical protein